MSLTTQKIDLNRQVEHIASREDLARFVRDLLADLEAEPETWENSDLPSFLQAVAAWTDDMDGYFLNRNEPVPRQPDWKTLGLILLAAKYYE